MTNCKRCDTVMVNGTAIKHDYSNSRGHCVFPTTENAKMVECEKCPECGYSTTLTIYDKRNAARIQAETMFMEDYAKSPMPNVSIGDMMEWLSQNRYNVDCFVSELIEIESMVR